MYTNSGLLQAVISCRGNGKFYRLPPDKENPVYLRSVVDIKTHHGSNKMKKYKNRVSARIEKTTISVIITTYRFSIDISTSLDQ
jgi:hypothetical protein